VRDCRQNWSEKLRERPGQQTLLILTYSTINYVVPWYKLKRRKSKRRHQNCDNPKRRQRSVVKRRKRTAKGFDLVNSATWFRLIGQHTCERLTVIPSMKSLVRPTSSPQTANALYLDRLLHCKQTSKINVHVIRNIYITATLSCVDGCNLCCLFPVYNFYVLCLGSLLYEVFYCVIN